ncbi:MAG: FAD:protein FMN transferase [Terracidiphilus sp.]|jgi:thiamine biosynthesis lipoprotein
MSHPTLFPEQKVFHRSCFAMNTRFSMVLVGIETERAEALAVAAECDLRACERMMSRFDAESPVSDLNRRATETAIQPPEGLWEILSLCRDYWKRSRGAFDITLWPLNHLWREHLGRGEEPTGKAIEQARLQTGFERLHLDEIAHTVRFQSKGMSIDLGGFGKGFAIERLDGSLRAQGVEQAFLSFGESSITVLGSHPHGPAWPVGITNMFQPSDTVHTFHLRNASLSSSGTAPFNRMGGPQVFGQNIDPRNGRPLEGYRTISVVSPSGIEAEVLSTALLVTPERDRAALISGFSTISAIEIVYRTNAGKFVPCIEWEYGL